jgi:hypothetical protein
MSELSPKEIVRKALKKGELDLLLLGRPEYQYIDRWVDPYNTDLTALLRALYWDFAEGQREQIKNRLFAAIKKIVNSYEGLFSVAGCVLYETAARSSVDSFGRPKPETSLGLPLDEIAAELRQSIRVFSFRLEKDKTGVGAQWPDGLLGDLRRLSKNTERLGGPSFCD